MSADIRLPKLPATAPDSCLSSRSATVQRQATFSSAAADVVSETTELVVLSAAVLAAEDTGDAAVLPQPASRETDRASTVTVPRTFFIIRMENPLQKNRLILQLASANHKQILLEQAAFYKNQTDKIYPIGRIFRYCVGVIPRDWRNAEENLFGFS